MAKRWTLKVARCASGTVCVRDSAWQDEGRGAISEGATDAAPQDAGWRAGGGWKGMRRGSGRCLEIVGRNEVYWGKLPRGSDGYVRLARIATKCCARQLCKSRQIEESIQDCKCIYILHFLLTWSNLLLKLKPLCCSMRLQCILICSPKLC